jgi:predicted transposase/invertase (TIGR01784 family)
MELTLIEPHYDVVFKKIFGVQTIGIIADFLGSTLDLPTSEYQDIRVVDPHLLRRHKNDKLGIVDLRITTKSGNFVAVELQVAAHPAIWQRMEYYNSKLLIDQMDAGNDFDQINRAISILIYYPILIKESKEFHNKFVRYDARTNISYPYSSEIHVLEVKKVKDADDSPLANWLRFFTSKTAEEFEMIAQTRPAIADAWGVVQLLSGDAEARRLAEYEEMSRRDNAARMKGAYKDGRQEGIIEVARNALRKNMEYGTVADLTGLPLDEIKRLAVDLS